MDSRVQIDINPSSRKERILIKHMPSEDLRDAIVGFFVHTACPDVPNSSERLLDGYCRISVLGSVGSHGVPGSYTAVEILPIHPIDMPEHIARIEENAAKFPKQGTIKS